MSAQGFRETGVKEGGSSRLSTGTLIIALLLSFLFVCLSGFWVWPTPLETAQSKGDLYSVSRGLPLPSVVWDLGRFDPPYPYPLRSLGPSPWEDPFRILWPNLFVDLAFWLAVSLLFVRIFKRTFERILTWDNEN